jgi:hypothetical protein
MFKTIKGKCKSFFQHKVESDKRDVWKELSKTQSTFEVVKAPNQEVFLFPENPENPDNQRKP